MFIFRFCAEFIEKRLKISPVGILLICAVLACVGLNLVSGIRPPSGAMSRSVSMPSARPSSGPPCWPWSLTGSRAPAPSPVHHGWYRDAVGRHDRLARPRLRQGSVRHRTPAQTNPARYEQYKARTPQVPLFLKPAPDSTAPSSPTPRRSAEAKTPDQKAAVVDASIPGDRKTLKPTRSSRRRWRQSISSCSSTSKPSAATDQ